VLAHSPQDLVREAPRITVLLAAHDRMDVLPECLRSFASQAVDGELELVVVDDGSTDGTAEWLAGFDPGVPFVFLTQPNAGAAAARNTGLPYASAPLCLFVNDDTIPLPGLVQGHLDEHARLAGQRAIVLGTFEQPPEVLERALPRVLERSSFVFAYTEMDPDVELNGTHFYTCNASVATDAVRAAGGFDEAFPCYTEDTELGVRLEKLGYVVRYRPHLRAQHHHVPRFESLRWRQEAVARAHVHLYVKHPELLEGANRFPDPARVLAQRAATREVGARGLLGGAIQALGDTNLVRLERAGGSLADVADLIERATFRAFALFNSLRWDDGTAAGLGELGLEWLHELMVRRPLALTDLPGGTRIALLRVPAGHEAACRVTIAAWLERCGPCADRTLLLWPDDVESAAVSELERTLARPVGRARRARGEHAAPCVAWLDEPVVREDDGAGEGLALRVLAAADRWIPSGAGVDERLRRLAALADTPVDDALEPTGPEDPGGSAGAGPAAERRTYRVLACPSWDDVGELAELVALCAPWVDDERIAVHLCLDSGVDEADAIARAFAPLERAFTGTYGAASLRLEIEAGARSEAERQALAARMDAELALRSSSASPRAALGLPVLRTLADARAWHAGLAEAVTPDAPVTGWPRVRRAPSQAPCPFTRRELEAARPATAPRAQAAASPQDATVTVLALARVDDPAVVARMAADVAAQEGVGAELVVVDVGSSDFRPDGAPEPVRELDGVRVVRPDGIGRGRALRSALEHVRTDVVALLDPECRPSPAWLVRSVAALEGDVDVVTCDYGLTDEDGRRVERGHPSAMGDAPGPFWHGGLVVRRSALATIDTRAFRPSELALYQRARRDGRVAHVAEPGFDVALASWRHEWETSRSDAALLALDERASEFERPLLSVSLCTYDRRETLLESLEAFSRQELPRGAYELVVVDDGSQDGTRELLERIELPVPATVVHQPNGGLSAARNTGLEHCRGELVLFVNDDTIPEPSLVEEHVRTHRRLAGEGLRAVLGSFEQPAEALDNALMRYLEASDEIFGFSKLTPGRDYDGMFFWTCNVSVPLAAVRAAGDFDVSFRHYGCEDTDLGVRLEALGMRVHYHPAARALHRHWIDFDYLVRRQRMVARAYVRFYRKHPRALDRWGGIERLTAEDCRASWRKVEALVPTFEAAVGELAALGVGALERVADEFAPVAQRIVEEVGRQVAALNRIWWWQGYEEGFAEHGLSGFDELWARAHETPLQAAPSAPIGAQLPPDRVELSVVVPTRDRPSELRALCAALAGQDLERERFEVLVCDDGSTPPVDARSLAHLGLDLRVVRRASGGPGPARNAGVARARGDVVVFLNDDAVPRPDLLRRHLAAHRGAGEERIVLGAFPLAPERRTDSFAHLVETTNLLFAQPCMRAGVLYDGSALCSGNVSLRRRALEAVGGFDEAFPFAGAEDSELGLRLERELGLRVLYDPSVVAEHDHALDVDAYARRQRVLGWSVALIARQHDDPTLATGSSAEPFDAAFVERLRADVERLAPEVAPALEAIRAVTARERGSRCDPRNAERIEPLVRLVGQVEFGRGLLCGHARVAADELFAAPAASAG